MTLSPSDIAAVTAIFGAVLGGFSWLITKSIAASEDRTLAQIEKYRNIDREWIIGRLDRLEVMIRK